MLAKVRKENVGGWMLWTTAGTFKACGVVEREIWAVVERDPSARAGSRCSTGTTASTLPRSSPPAQPRPAGDRSRNHIGKTVDACAGDLYLGQFVVPPGGMITTDIAITEIEVGFTFTPLIQPLVQEVQMPDGISWGLPKRNVSVTVALVDTLSAKVNNDHIPTSNASQDPGLAPDRYTGKFKSWLLGIAADQAPLITAPLPLSFNLTTIQTEVEV